MATKNYALTAKENIVPYEENIKAFASLLDELENLSDKKKALWREIYANAITDRHNARIMFDDLMTLVMGDETKHAIHDVNISKYIERMSRANDQLLKLAELIADAEKKNDSIDPEEVYKTLSNG